MPVTAEDRQQLLRAQINTETAQIAWSELLRHFAGGHVLAVSDTLDLIEVAARFASDDIAAVRQWLDQRRLARVSDQQARAWLEADAVLWTVVARPWVLVQENRPA